MTNSSKLGGVRLATPQEEAEAEEMLSRGRRATFIDWEKRLRSLRCQIDKIIDEIDEASYSLV